MDPLNIEVIKCYKCKQLGNRLHLLYRDYRRGLSVNTIILYHPPPTIVEILIGTQLGVAYTGLVLNESSTVTHHRKIASRQ